MKTPTWSSSGSSVKKLTAEPPDGKYPLSYQWWSMAFSWWPIIKSSQGLHQKQAMFFYEFKSTKKVLRLLQRHLVLHWKNLSVKIKAVGNTRCHDGKQFSSEAQGRAFRHPHSAPAVWVFRLSPKCGLDLGCLVQIECFLHPEFWHGLGWGLNPANPPFSAQLWVSSVPECPIRKAWVVLHIKKSNKNTMIWNPGDRSAAFPLCFSWSLKSKNF